MTHIEYFKLQAKNLFRDYKTQFVDESGCVPIYDYKPKYFDINNIFVSFDWDEENLSLMNIQHLFACMLGFKKWADLVNASEETLELVKLRWDNQDKIPLAEWEDQIMEVCREHNITFDSETELEYFKHCLSCHEGYGSPYPNYLLRKTHISHTI